MSRSLKISFVLPRTGEWPSGGFRIIYEHANHLARSGHSVTIVHPGRLVINPTMVDHAKNAVRYALKKMNGRYTPHPWLKMEPNIRFTVAPSLAERYVPDGDVVIATAWQTAEWAREYSPRKGRRFYLIQHLETWNGPEDRVYATWKAPLQKVVPSKWLAEIAENMGEKAIYIPYGLDVDAVQIVTPQQDRKPTELMMLYHNAKWKGCDDGLEALHLVREQVPDIHVNFFGVPDRPASLPDWIDYHQSPSAKHLRELYNQAAIFVAPSRTEGWGLTGCEALLCGAALAATDIDGHREFAFHEKTALTSPVRTPAALAENVVRLIRDNDLRIQLAKGGNDFVRQLTYQRSGARFEAALSGQE